MSGYHRGPILTRLFRVRFPSRLYDRGLGWLLGGRICRITHLGRRSGRSYRTVLEVVGRDQRTGEVLVVSGLGPTADWYRNVLANGSAEVETGRRHFAADVRVPSEDEAIATFAAYEHHNRWIRPLLRHLLSKLLGWKYDGSAPSRRRLVQQLPMVAFTPTEPAPR